jgi:CAAX protease family protein
VKVETAALAPSEPDRYRRAAGPIHTICVLAIFVLWPFLGMLMVDQMTAEAIPHRVRLYLFAIFFDWLLFAFIVAGVRSGRAPLSIVLGDRWQSARQVWRDIGVAAAYWFVSIILLAILNRLLHADVAGRNLQYLFPRGGAEFALWLALSVTAGICEETIFRGYLQRQFMAFTKSVPAGILLSAAAFGVAHAYQGMRRAILIGLYGVMFGILAHWRGTVRPGMIAHAWQDSLTGVLAGFIRH